MDITSLAISIAALAVSIFNARSSSRSAKAAERSADAAARSVDHQIDREKSKGTVSRPPVSFGVPPVLVANVGAVPFTVVQVGLGGVPFKYPFGEQEGTVRDVPPGGSASFQCPDGFRGHGPAYAVLADGTVISEEIKQA